MASSKRNSSFDDEPDWISSDTKRKGANRFALGGYVLVMLLLVGVFVIWQSEKAERRQAQAEWEQSLAMQQALEQSEDAERRLEAEQLKQFVESEGQVQTIEDLNRAFRLANGDVAGNEKRAEELQAEGLFRFKTDDLDGAVRAFEQATQLDPKYTEVFQLMRAYKAERDRTAPPPREVKRP